MKNYQKSLAYPVCELPDYDFNESFDIDYLRCQYDARAIELINLAEESITEDRYGAIREARDKEATRILSEPPTRTRRARRAYPPPNHHPPPNHPPAPRSNRPLIKIGLDVSRATAGVGSCGICLSDEIPLAKMTKTNCNHEYCDACITQIIRTTPRCAFCRGNMTLICVNSMEVYNKILNK